MKIEKKVEVKYLVSMSIENIAYLRSLTQNYCGIHEVDETEIEKKQRQEIFEACDAIMKQPTIRGEL